MDKESVTKRGRPPQYSSNAERQRAYRQRKKSEKLKENAQWHYRQRKLNANRIINETVLAAESLFAGTNLVGSSVKEIDRDCLPDWITRLVQARRNLTHFIGQVRKL